MTVVECAQKLSVSIKTLRNWENCNHAPIGYMKERIKVFIGGKTVG